MPRSLAVDVVRLDPARVTGPYQLFPPLAPVEFAALVDSVREHGVLTPVEVDEHGQVLDGHHRVEAARLVGLSRWPSIVRAGLSEQDKLTHARVLNVVRRHLRPVERAPHVAALRALGWSTRRIAGATGTSEATVRRDLAAAGAVSPGRVTGADGKSYRPRSPGVFASGAAERRRAAAALAGVAAQDLPAGTTDLRRVERLGREARARARREAPAGALPASADLRLCDLRELDLAAGSVDLVFTDPPYRQADMHVWDDLGRLAVRVLRPGGLLLAVCGQARVPDAAARLTAQLQWWWMFAVAHDYQQQVRYRGVACGWKPVLVLRAPGGREVPRWTVDVSRAGRREKDDHPWQQGTADAVQWISALTPPGGLVVDPFMGSGTTGVAAVSAGRRFVGCDVDPDAVRSARARVAAVRAETGAAAAGASDDAPAAVFGGR